MTCCPLRVALAFDDDYTKRGTGTILLLRSVCIQLACCYIGQQNGKHCVPLPSTSTLTTATSIHTSYRACQLARALTVCLQPITRLRNRPNVDCRPAKRQQLTSLAQPGRTSVCSCARSDTPTADRYGARDHSGRVTVTSTTSLSLARLTVVPLSGSYADLTPGSWPSRKTKDVLHRIIKVPNSI